MIRLGTNSHLALASALLAGTYAAPAQADVLEIGKDGARWIAGGQNSAASTQSLPASANAKPQVRMQLPEAAPAAIPGVPAVYVAKVWDVSRRYDLSPALIEALVWQESRWQANAVSPAGARGLTQLMPATARYLGVDPDDPMQNLEGGARYLREQLNRFDGDLEKALAAYNAGPSRVIRANGVPRIRETRNYVAAIIGRLASHTRST